MMKKLLPIFLLFIFSESYSQHTYRFQGNLNEFNTFGPALTETLDATCVPAPANGSFLTNQTINTSAGSCGAAASETVFGFNQYGGLSYPNNPSFISGTYTINVFFKFSTHFVFQRVIDFKNSTTDNGLYTNINAGNDIYIWDGTTATPGTVTLVNDTYYLFTLVRDGATDLLTIYVNGVAAITNYNDAAQDFVPTTSTTPIIFFRDNNGVGGCEASAGAVKYISLQPTTSTAGAVASIWSNVCLTILPVNLTDFTAQKNNSDVLLQWKTLNEINTAYFDVEKSNDGQNFTAASRVNAKNAAVNSYSYNDVAGLPLNSGNTYYRLKIADINGRITYSSKIKVANGKETTVTVFPNPTTSIVTISGLNNKDVVRLLSIDGKTLLQKTTGGVQSMILNIEKYKPGTYILQVQNDTEITQQKLLKY